MLGFGVEIDRCSHGGRKHESGEVRQSNRSGGETNRLVASAFQPSTWTRIKYSKMRLDSFENFTVKLTIGKIAKSYAPGGSNYGFSTSI